MKPARATLGTPVCHWGRIPGPQRSGPQPLVWICEYPYRTVRASGPDRNCEGCPIWAQVEQGRACGIATSPAEQIRRLQAMLAS
ncbi:MAG: hypothetical protein R2752_01770 [Vicinamibacterales bacterium]